MPLFLTLLKVTSFFTIFRRLSHGVKKGRKKKQKRDCKSSPLGDDKFYDTYQSRGFMVGKRSTSRMEALSVSSMTRRSMPKPRPPVGGMPYSKAVTKS